MIFNKNETRLFIVSLWTLTLEPAVSSLIVPPNGLIYSRVENKNNKTVEPNMQILQVILRFISANIVCIVKSIPTKENPKRFCTVSNSPFLSLSLSRLKTTEPVDVRGILWIPPADLQRSPSMLWGSQRHMFSDSQVLCFSAIFSLTQMTNSKRTVEY